MLRTLTMRGIFIRFLLRNGTFHIPMEINLLRNGENDFFRTFHSFCLSPPKYRLLYVLNYQDLFIFAEHFGRFLVRNGTFVPELLPDSFLLI